MFSNNKTNHFIFGRDWTGDLKKLPNIKMRKVSSKVSDTKTEELEVDDDDDDGGDESHEADDQELDGSMEISASH